MYLNSKGSILVTTLIVFSIIITMSMMCIGLHYSNSTIFNLEYKEANLKEKGYGSIDIVHSNIVKEVNLALQNTSNEYEFNNYFLGNDFLNNIKDISKSDIDKTLINIPTEININNMTDFLEFKITSTVRDDIYVKKFQANVIIKNPFSNQIIDIEKEEKNNINELVRVFDYKEI